MANCFIHSNLEAWIWHRTRNWLWWRRFVACLPYLMCIITPESLETSCINERLFWFNENHESWWRWVKNEATICCSWPNLHHFRQPICINLTYANQIYELKFEFGYLVAIASVSHDDLGPHNSCSFCRHQKDNNDMSGYCCCNGTSIQDKFAMICWCSFRWSSQSRMIICRRHRRQRHRCTQTKLDDWTSKQIGKFWVGIHHHHYYYCCCCCCR